MNTDETKFKLYLFRYLGDIISGEFVNLAVCLVEDSDRPDRFVGFEVMKDWSRLKSFFPSADVDLLKSWCRDVAQEVKQTKQSRNLLLELEHLSANIDVSVDSQAVLSHKQPEDEMRILTRCYLR